MLWEDGLVFFRFVFEEGTGVYGWATERLGHTHSLLWVGGIDDVALNGLGQGVRGAIPDGEILS